MITAYLELSIPETDYIWTVISVARNVIVIDVAFGARYKPETQNPNSKSLRRENNMSIPFRTAQFVGVLDIFSCAITDASVEFLPPRRTCLGYSFL